MAAIRSHSSDTTDANWDASAMVANMKSDGDESYYKSAFAWQDPDGDPTSKSSYKFPHHMVSSDGTVGPANTRAASAGIGALNGARGGAKIPDGDRKGVYNHLAKHIDDSGKDVPELASLDEVESRAAGLQLLEYKAFVFREIKTNGDATGTFSGYASTYNKDLQGDRILPGAFGQTIADKKGMVPIFYQHDIQSLPLGLSTSLAEDGKGLSLSGQLLMNSTAGAEAYAMLQLASNMGYRMGMSIGFNALDWDFDDEVRWIKEIDLWEVSLTPFPAQPKAFVQDVKTFRDLERRLREAERFSRSDAKRIMRAVSGLNPSSRGMPDDSSRINRVLTELARTIGESECL